MEKRMFLNKNWTQFVNAMPKRSMINIMFYITNYYKSLTKFYYCSSPLYLHTVLFGPYTESDSLIRLVNIAKRYTPPDSISCQFTRVMDEIVLTNLFTNMATHLQEHK